MLRSWRMQGHARVRCLAALACAVLCSACVDFAEPEIPNRSAPANLNINMRVFDSGILQVDGSLSPGRDSLGFQRAVQSPFVFVSEFLVEPRGITEQGIRTYSSVFEVPRGETLGPWELTGPAVQDVGVLPDVRWYGLRRLDPDTLVVTIGQDVILNMDSTTLQSDPEQRFRQWFLEVRAGFSAFRLSGDGAVPLRIRIPHEWVPSTAQTGGFAQISLIYYQTAQVRSSTNLYVASVTLDTRLNWTVRVVQP